LTERIYVDIYTYLLYTCQSSPSCFYRKISCPNGWNV